MLAELARRTVAAKQPVLAAHGLSMWGYIVLTALDRTPIRTQSALAQAIGADKTPSFPPSTSCRSRATSSGSPTR